MAKTTSAQRVQKRAKRLNKVANSFGYKSWVRFSTAVLRGDIILTVSKPDKKNQ